MARQGRLIQSFPFAFGVSESEDKNQLEISKLKSAVNVRYHDKNSILLCKNFGKIMQLPESIFSVQEKNGRVYGFSDTEVFSIDVKERSHKKIGSYLNADISRRNIFQGSKDILNPDLTKYKDEISLVFEINGQIRYSSYNINSDTIITGKTLDQSGKKPKIINVGGNKVAVWVRDSKILIWTEDILGNNTNSAFFTSGEVSKLELREGNDLSGFWIDYKDNVGNKTRFFNLTTFQAGDEQNDIAGRIHETDKSDTGSFYNFNLWTKFLYKGHLYKVYWNEFRGYFVLNDEDQIVGKFLGALSPPIDKDGVSFAGSPITEGGSIYFPALFHGVVRSADADEIFQPLGLALISIKIDDKNFLGDVSGLGGRQTIISSAITKIISDENVTELGFCEAPEIRSERESGGALNSIIKKEVTATYRNIKSFVFAIINSSELSTDYEVSAIKSSVNRRSTFSLGANVDSGRDFFEKQLVGDPDIFSDGRDFTIYADDPEGRNLTIELGSGERDDLDGSRGDYILVIKKNNDIKFIGINDSGSGNYVDFERIDGYGGGNTIFGNLFDDQDSLWDDIRNADANLTYEIYNNPTALNNQGSFDPNNLSSAEEEFLDYFFESLELGLSSDKEINNFEYLLSTFKQDGNDIKIGFTGADSAPDADFIKELKLTAGVDEIFDTEVLGLVSSTSGNERVYTIPNKMLMEDLRYRLEITTKDEDAWGVNVDPLSEAFSVNDLSFTITSLKIVSDSTDDKFKLVATFDNLPDFGDSFPFYFNGDEIGIKSSTNFVYSSHENNEVTFEGDNSINDTGFVVGQNETFNLEILTGSSPSEALEKDNQSVAYLAVFKWVDSEGKVYRSRASNLINVVIKKARIGEGNNPASVPVEITNLNLTNKENVKIELYRSSLVQSIISNSSFAKVGEIDNNKDREKDIFVDSVTESNLKELFLGFGVDQPRSGNISTFFKKRLFIAKDNQLYYSEPIVDEVENGINFKIDSVNLFSSKILGIAGLDNSLVVFTEDQSFLFNVGDEPIPIKSLDGHEISSHKSIVNFSYGIIFHSNQGIFILDRGGSIQYVGEDVQKSIQGLDVVASKIQKNTQEIWFLLSNGDSLVFNYLYRKWSFEQDNTLSLFFLDKTQYKFDVAGRILSSEIEGPNVWSSIETGDIPLSNLQQYKALRRVLFAGDFKAWAGIRIKMAFNSSLEFSEVREVTREVESRFGLESVPFGEENMPFAKEEENRFQFMTEPKRKKCYSIRIRFEILSKNAIISNIAFEMIVFDALQKLLPQQRF